ncbi:MAG: FliM/FliN family flagellar motor switch protein [Pseudorhodobacter sp.]|nr:FliM/FliN family flagellar motor switch protein [Pseudorhodobacter sp.]
MEQGVLRRKAAVRAVAPECGGADNAWPLAMARAARDAMALRLDVTRISVQRLSLTEVLELPPELALITVLEGPGEGLGVLALAPAVLAGLIEAQTIGRVSANPVQARKPTRTDAAMVAGVFDRALEGLETALLAEDDLIWAAGFRYASFLEDPRPLGLLLEDVPYRVLQAEVSLGGGLKGGTVLLALPAEGRGRRPDQGQAVPEAAAELVFSTALGEQVMAADCALEAVLYRMTIPLSAVMGLKVDDLVPLPMAALDRIGLDGIGGRQLAVGKLGQNRGMRAVRLAGEARAAAPLATGKASAVAGFSSPTQAPPEAGIPRLMGTG